MKSNRRNFIKKTSLTLFGFSLLGKTSFAKPPLVLACNVMTKDYYGIGPFYTANAPLLSSNDLALATETGERIQINGHITNLDCTQVLQDVTVEMWHANDAGEYDNSGYNLRGKVISDTYGNFTFETILPGKYLNGAQYRPSHIHFKFTPSNAAPIVTQLYFEGDTSIPIDAAASITSGEFDATHRIITLTPDTTGKKIGYWDIALDAEPEITGVNDIHLEKGIIYNAMPNPFEEKVAIQYGVFKEDKISLQIIDSSGKIIETLVNEKQKPDKYNIVWQPKKKLANSVYYLVLKVNDLQVSYQRLLKK
jgi:protocatechuate 3,4-dioxygenase beta subunit